MKVTNLGASPVSVFCGGVSMAVAPNDYIDSENFTVAEIEFVKKYPQQFGVEGEPSDGHIDADDYASAKRDRETLNAIVDLFGTPDIDRMNVKAAVDRLIQDQNTSGVATKNDDAFNSPLTTADVGTDLAAALALLDDANDDHWTQAGLPDIQTLKTLTGGDVTRSMVDQLPEGDKRVRKV